MGTRARCAGPGPPPAAALCTDDRLLRAVARRTRRSARCVVLPRRAIQGCMRGIARHSSSLYLTGWQVLPSRRRDEHRWDRLPPRSLLSETTDAASLPDFVFPRRVVSPVVVFGFLVTTFARRTLVSSFAVGVVTDTQASPWRRLA